ncbi:MAG: flagellar biosynthesis protein FlhA [Rhodothermaceae bacterium]|nr:flagellar biosynthesis protein FlhA [Rhodothermaceae bacterium]
MTTLAVPIPAPRTSLRFGLDALAASGVVMILLVMVVPLPGFLLDLLLATNIAISLGILLTAFYAQRPLDFAIFPGLLLITTLFRLSLNVASTRLILSEAKAGALIAAFGNFVVAGNFVVGGIVFLVLVLINFIVITKGSGRIAEVGARFTLDALPGKQMAIDADLNAGLIDETEAKQRRVDVTREADFYGAMDGASKFVRGDAIAGLIITGVNIVGGLVIGVTQLGMSMGEAGSTFTLLSIGDGLVSQIPALLISTAAGLIVSRASGEGNMVAEMKSQLFASAVPLVVTGGFLMILGLMPGLPLIPFWALGIGAIALGQRSFAAEQHAGAEAAKPPALEPEPEQSPSDLLLVEPLELEIGYGLIPLVDPAQGGDLLDRVGQLRRQLATELGLVIPPVRVRDNVALGANHYTIKLRGNPVGEGEVMPGYHLALLPDGFDGSVPGLKTNDPTFGLPAVWVPERHLAEAERQGLTVVEAPSVVTTHLLETLRTHAHRLLDRQEVSGLLDTVKTSAPTLIEELTPALLSVGEIQKVLKSLLRERVPIRDLVTILEALADHAPRTKSVEVLTEYVRAALAPSITRQFTSPEGRVHLVVLDPVLEQHLLEKVDGGELNASTLGLAPEKAQQFLDAAERLAQRLLVDGHPPVLLTSPVLRGTLARFVEGIESDLAVLSYNDLTHDAPLDVVDHLALP